jgi:radical SAM superfamily enzyme with C-terminal helix-hairpin-helix motif
VDVAVVDHGFRSVTGVPYPLDVNSATMDELTAVPGLGRKRAGDVVVNRPYSSPEELADAVDVDLSAFAVARSPEGAD